MVNEGNWGGGRGRRRRGWRGGTHKGMYLFGRLGKTNKQKKKKKGEKKSDLVPRDDPNCFCLVVFLNSKSQF